MNFSQALKLIFNEFLYGGHLISLGAVGIVFSSAILLEIKIDLDFLIIVYLFSYNSILYNRYREFRIDYLTNPERTKNLRKYFKYISLILCFSILITTGIFIFNNKFLALFFLILLSLLTFLYTEYFKNITKNIFIFKNIYFSFVTGLLLILLVLYYSYPILNFIFFIIFIFVFLRMFINTVFLDIKDVKGDNKIRLKTIPILFGETKTLKILQLLSMISILPILIGVYLGFLHLFSLVLIFIVPYSFYYFFESKKRKNFYLVNYFLADLEFILWPILLLLSKNLI